MLAVILSYVSVYPTLGVFVAGMAHALQWSGAFHWALSFNTTWQWSDRTLYVLGTYAVHELLWLSNFIFVAADHGYDVFGLQRWKIERPKGVQQSPPAELVKKAIRAEFISHSTVQLVTLYFLWPIVVSRGASLRGPLPSFLNTVALVMLAAVVNDFGFYLAHRAFHHPKLYKYHKQHHRFHATTGFAAEYAGPVEQVVANQVPTVIVAVAAGFPVLLWWCWLWTRIVRTYITHSGFAIPYLLAENTRHHDYHHSRNIKNFSGTPLYDLIFGTYNEKWFNEMMARRNKR